MGAAVGHCRAPIAADGACTSDADVCVMGYWCADETTCKPWNIAREAGAYCNDDQDMHCDPIEQLACVGASCERIGDGHQGSECSGLDLADLHPCDPGLFCEYQQGEGGMGPTETCEVPHAADADCQADRECASGACQPNGKCASAYCQTPGY